MTTNIDLSPSIELSLLNIHVVSESSDDSFEILSRTNHNDILHLRVKFHSAAGAPLSKSQIRWTIPALNVKGIWSSNLLYEKRIRADWEAASLNSRISTDAPLITLFDHTDQNIMTAAVDDLVHRISIEAPVREEDNLVYFSFTFFEENQDATEHIVDLRIDVSPQLFSAVIQDFAQWWKDRLPPILTPIPEAFEPVYSTWYAFHQELDAAELLSECKAARKLGYKIIILDDGWQTMDNRRGYDYTGDWQPDRFPDMAGFVNDVHDTDMKIMFWYSVPFCGKHSKAYQKFKGKFLTENHRWAPVFDPRYPEVRDHLIGLYTNALKDWNVDGFKLDFIDDFKMYSESAIGKGDGRDYANVEEAVERLLSDAVVSLQKVKKDLIIEFRQKYISPALRQFANMFRAFDCPNDAVTNRIRTTDVKLLSDTSAVHSDMITWPVNEQVEVAALQMASILFSVPQISVRMHETSPECKEMLKFYTDFWVEHREVLMHGDFKAFGPMSNYPILRSQKNDVEVIGLYDNHMVDLGNASIVHIINGKVSPSVFLKKLNQSNLKSYIVKDCRGRVVREGYLDVSSSLEMIEVPQSGIISLS